MKIKFDKSVNKDISKELDKYLNEYFDLKPRLENMERNLDVNDPIQNHTLVFGKQKELQQIRSEIEFILHEHELTFTVHQTNGEQWIEVKSL